MTPIPAVDDLSKVLSIDEFKFKFSNISDVENSFDDVTQLKREISQLFSRCPNFNNVLPPVLELRNNSKLLYQ